MNYGRGFPLPHYRNTDSWNPANGIPIPPDDGIGQTRGSWTAAMLGGPIPGSGDLCETPITTIPVNNGVMGKESESWMPTQVGNGIMGHRDSWTEIHQENGIAQNGGNWNPVIPNGNSWTPVTPVKPTNLVTKPTNQLENENWGDLVGMYKDLLREEPINLNEVAQEVYPIDGNQNQNRCVRRNLNPILNSTPVPNLNPILNSTPVPNLTPIQKPNRDSNPISYFTSEDPANWDGNLLSAIMRPKRSVESVPFLNRPQNNDVHDLNRIPVSDSSTQIQRNIIGPNRVNSVLENQQSHTLTLNNILGGYNSKKLPTDGFPVPYRPCYNLNSPPRSEPDATSSGITGPLPFAPITPDTGRKQTETQWVPAKNTQESQSQSQRKEITDNHENDQLHNIVESTSSAVSTTQKDNLVCEEGDEMGIDLNKTPNQKTPARRKKHRPKVIREKKPKKTKTPKDPNETPVKRKYVRKKVLDVSESPKENGIEVSPSPSPNGARVKRKYVKKKGVEKSGVDEDTGSKVKTPVKSCKKQLNFDLECVRDESQTREESQMREGINLNVNPQDIEHEKRVNSVLERSGIKVAENNVNGLGSPMGKTRDHALNILARNLSMRNGYKSQVGQSQSQMVNVDEQRGIKRQFFEQVNPRNLNAMDSLVMYQKLLLGGTARVDRGQDLGSVLLESHKRTKTHNGVSALEDNSRTYRNVPAMQLLNSCSQRVNPNYQMMNGGGGNVTGHFRPPVSAITQNLQKHPEHSGILQRQLQGNRANNMTAMVSWNRPPATPPKEYVRSGVITYPGPLLDKKRTPTPNSSNQKSNLEVHQKPTKPRGALRKQKVAVAVSVEDITCMLERLCIYNENDKMRNALVPYKGSNVIVPFEPIKKRKPRPKVDLDPESDRLWRLLMGPEGSEANENMDKDKEKWWENERRVFRGRADSFIARMHLVQGDRRFSRWKGSVVDSVIGVFLTQNVSDHLSSSAFMSLAAKFSVKSTNMNETHGQNRTCVVVEEPIDTILPNDNVKCQQKIGRQPVFNQTSILSQDSLDSSTIQTVDEIRSSSGSNSEAEDQTTEPGPTNPIQPEKVNMFNELFSRETTTTPLDRSQYIQEIPKMPQSGSPGFGVLGGESVSSLPSGYHTSNVTYQNEANSKGQNYSSQERVNTASTKISRERKAAIEDEKKKTFDWDSLRRDVFLKCEKKERSNDAKDSLDYEALRNAHVNQISDAIRERGMNNLLADRIKDFLDRLVRDHGSIDLEWLRDVPPDKAKDYLLSIRGLGLKSVECVRLLTLHHLAFPVDTNVGRIAVRLGWVPLQPLPESLQLHLLEMYPVLESIQKYLWPRLCKLDQLTLYELHYQMITFGKVFCTKSKPNCNACPMRAECRHFASAFASARLALPGPEEKKLVPSVPNAPNSNQPIPPIFTNHMSLPPSENNNNNNNNNSTDTQFPGRNCEPIIEEPTTPEAEPAELSLSDIEDQYYEDDDEIPTIKLDMNEFTMNLQKMQESMDIQGDMSQALVALNPQAASIPTPKLKNVSRLRTEHQVYELPDSHPILEGLDRREPDDPSPYLLAIWTPGETANSMQPPERGCQGQETGILCDKTTCFSCNCIKEANSQVVRGTILMPCRTATRGSFPLNGTYFQVNEMFADHSSSLKPIEVPRAWIWNLPRRTVYFGTSVSTIFKGLTTQEIQQCFWRGFVCVRGFDQKSRSPRPLMARLHFPASKLVNNKKNEDK